MKKIAVILSLASILAGSALAGQKAAPPKTIHCAVLTQNVVTIADATKAHRYADYKGRRYYFCCFNCPRDFKANPAKYAKHESLPIPKK